MADKKKESKEAALPAYIEHRIKVWDEVKAKLAAAPKEGSLSPPNPSISQ